MRKYKHEVRKEKGIKRKICWKGEIWKRNDIKREKQ